MNQLPGVLGVYLPVLALYVFSLLLLTRHRDPFPWADRFCIESRTAGWEVLWIFAYLLITPLTLGFVFKTGCISQGQIFISKWTTVSGKSSVGYC